jgi:nondiscriminating aspartyl-tRNA synthetase
MNLESEMITYAFKKVKELYDNEIEKVFGSKIIIPKMPFPRMKLKDVYDELEKRYGYKVSDEEKNDMTTEAEKLSYKLAQDKFNSEFLFITEYPAEKRAFYHMRNEKGILQGYDLIWRGVEITSGAQREHRYE